jgi:hypothetical protein
MATTATPNEHHDDRSGVPPMIELALAPDATPAADAKPEVGEDRRNPGRQAGSTPSTIDLAALEPGDPVDGLPTSAGCSSTPSR